MFDGVCDQTKELQTLSGSMSNYIKWIISSSGGYMFVRFAVRLPIPGPSIQMFSSIGFSAKIHYGNETLNNKVTVSMFL